MKTYEVFEIATGELCYRYTNTSQVELDAYPSDRYEQRPVDEAPVEPQLSSMTVYNGRRKLTKLEWRKLLHADEEEAFDQIRATVETMDLPGYLPRSVLRTFVNRYNEATVMDMDDPDQERGFGLLVAMGLMQYNRIKEILNA
jgi:hypothetical protein